MMSAEQARALVKRGRSPEGSPPVDSVDRQQLPAIEAGRPFAMLLERGMQFTEMRQVEAPGTEHRSSGRSPGQHRAPGSGCASRSSLDIPTRLPIAMRGLMRLCRTTSRSTEQREQTLIMTGVNDDRREINERIRRVLRREQVLKGAEQQASVLVQRDLTPARA